MFGFAKKLYRATQITGYLNKIEKKLEAHGVKDIWQLCPSTRESMGAMAWLLDDEDIVIEEYLIAAKKFGNDWFKIESYYTSRWETTERLLAAYGQMAGNIGDKQAKKIVRSMFEKLKSNELAEMTNASELEKEEEVLEEEVVEDEFEYKEDGLDSDDYQLATSIENKNSYIISLIAFLLDDDQTVSLHQKGELVIEKSRDQSTLLDQIEIGENNELVVYDEAGKKLGWILLVDNDPDRVIADMSSSPIIIESLAYAWPFSDPKPELKLFQNLPREVRKHIERIYG